MCGRSAATRVLLVALLMTLLVALLVARSAAEMVSPLPLYCRHKRCRNTSYSMFEVDGNRLEITYKTNTLTMNCTGGVILDSPALPRAEPALRVSHVLMERCPLPTGRSLAATLAALNVTLDSSEPDALGEMRGNLTLYKLPPMPQLAAKHFVGLERLVQLWIFGLPYAPLSPERGFLTPLQSLRSLQLHDVVLPTNELDALPFSLRELKMNCTEGMEQLPAAPALESLSLIYWKTLKPASLARCDSLHKLSMQIANVNDLQDGWLANCSRLETLDIEWAKSQTALPPKLLLGTRALEHFSLTGGSFETLPAELLDYSPSLHTLLLKGNHLKMLVSDMFVVARRVRVLDLSKNELDSRVMDAVSPLEELTELHLSENPSLGDVCKTDGYSAIRKLTTLTALDLTSTNVARICKDWREDMTLLATLDLRRTNMSQLLFEDLQFTRTVVAKVSLPAASLTTMEITREGYNNAARRLQSSASVYFDGMLECNCRIYWTRRALDLTTFIHYDNVECMGEKRRGELLRDKPLEDMECARPKECSAAALPDACACAARPDDDSAHDRLLVRVRCEHASLTRVPHPRAINDSTERLYELLLAHNNITEIHANDLQHNIKGLDLRYNLLERIDEETAARLRNIDGVLNLAGNPLDCSCRNVPLLRALRKRSGTRMESAEATCSNGIKLYTAFGMSCLQSVSLSTCLAAGFAALFALVAAVLVLLGSRSRRFFARAVLHRWGCGWPTAEPEEDDRSYDAFVTFSYRDQAVVYELMARLEPTYRLCIHHRDWVPGCFISEQIVKSVRESRRTVALVSRHFLASSWARAELREAHTAAMLDARPRLIVVLLEEPALLEMDEHLRGYVATKMYLRWGEPWFWDKLAVALPKPRASAPEQSTDETGASASSYAISANI